jgi:hypothetical protein
MKSTRAKGFVSLFILAAAASAQSTTETTNAVPKKSFWNWGPVAVSGFADTAYSVNFNHPTTDVNQLRNFDVKANTPGWNALKFAFEHSPDPVGFRVDVGFGELFNTFHAGDPGGGIGWTQQFLQGYVSVKPKSWKGVQVDVGKFLTSAGAELTDTNLNWNYSRGLLFALGPYYHMGVRTTVPIGDSFTAGVQLVNGWNNINLYNGSPTVGLTGAITRPKFTWAHTYYVGKERFIAEDNRRHFYDTALTVAASDKTNLYLTFDYGTDTSRTIGSKRFYGFGTAVRHALNSRFALSPRFEWYNDADGVMTGASQQIKEVTMTGEMRLAQGFMTRLEFRRDWSDQPYFLRGTDVLRRQQNTVLVGLLYVFGPDSR